MGVLLNFLFIVFFIIVPIVAVCMQTIPLRMDNVTFRDTDPVHGYWLVRQYAAGTFEQRFGYPTGYFYVDSQRSQEPARLLMREAQPSGAVTDGCSTRFGSVSLAGFDGGCGPGCFMFLIVSTIAAPFFFVSTFDRFFRLILRSRVDVRLQKTGPDTVASFAFYGPGGYSLRRRYGQVFEKPTLPVSIGNPPAAPSGPAQPRGNAA
jgi:hypothetical protein